MKATARAHPNIALVKYWGKRDEARILPHQSSLSLTLAPIHVQTTVAWETGLERDLVEINGREATGTARDRVVHLLDEVRRESSMHRRARMVSRGDFPEAAGLASSAAAFAALAVAARSSAGLVSDVRRSSQLARTGSGSACRSIQGGICVWHRGEAEDGHDSYATQLHAADHWPELRMVVAVVSHEEKDVKSRDGMRNTVETSPYYPAWVKDAEEEIARASAALAARDLPTLGALSERNAWRMHATSLAADPPLCYLLPETLAVILAARRAREEGLPVWFTLDAGPNPVLLTDAAHEAQVEVLAQQAGALSTVRCTPGGDATLVDTHLF